MSSSKDMDRSLLAFSCFFAVGLFLFIARRLRYQRTLFPPGPPGRFLIGNALEFNPSAEVWKTFTKWKETYGAFISPTPP